MIVGTNSENNVRVVQTGPTYANTYANVSIYGNTAYGSATTHYGGNQTMIVGTRDTDLAVIMFNRGEAGYNDAIDARSELGADWEAIVRDGIRTCT